jgi:FMN phosphatase YigB (HAD superfamily)/DNA-binding XRE family transcriptional regulator
MDEKGLGRRLQQARMQAGLTQQALCQQAQLSYSTLTKIERGAIKAPSIFTIQSIAAALGVTLDELMGGTRGVAGKAAKGRSKSGVSFVYFDINGCLVGFFHSAFTRLEELTGAPADVIETAFWHYNDEACRGDMTMEEFNRNFAREIGLETVDWMQYYLEAIRRIDGMDEMVRWASEHYRIGLLTNIMPGFVAVMRERGLLPDVKYDIIVDSSEVRAIKPEAHIYEIAEEKANCPASEILLIDDSRTNLMAAEKHGWHVLWFNDYEPEPSIKRIRRTLEPAEQ